MPSRRRPLAGTAARRLATAAATALVVVAVWATPASAHAQLETTVPASGAVLKVSPPEVVLHFGEDVEIDFGSVRVYDATGARVDSGGAHHPGTDGHAVAEDLPANLPDGAYVVAWRVISADSHPVHGAFIFSVGTSRGLARASVLATALANESGSTVVGAIYWFVRFAAFAGLLSLIGIVAVALLAAPRSLRNRRVRRAAWAAWGVLAAATVAGIVIQGVYAAALPLGDVVRASLVREVLATRFGRVEELRLVLLALAVPLLATVTARRAGDDAPPVGVTASCAVVGAGLLATPGLAGHASTGSAVLAGFVLDLVHLGSASLWLGGLVVLGCLLASRRDEPTGAPLGEVARSISSIAFVAVVVVVASGTLQAVRQVGSLPALVDTDYGRLLLVKVAIVVVLIALGAKSRSLVRRGAPAGSDAAAWPALRRSVTVELCVAAAVLAVTALLVNAPPAREEVNLPFTASFTALGDQVNVIVSPASAGVRNVLHVYVLSSTGRAEAVPEVDASVTLPAEHVGPLALPLRLAGIGHYRDSNVTFFAPGNWVLTVTLRTTAIDEQVVPLPLPVR